MKLKKQLLTIAIATTLTGCGGGFDDSSAKTTFDSLSNISVSGGPVKGPLAYAQVKVFGIAQVDGVLEVDRSNVISTGSTNERARMTGVSLPAIDSGKYPYILEFSTVDKTVDLTTGAAPVIKVLRTIVTKQMVSKELPLYATPLTTMALDLALSRTSDVTALPAELETAASQVASTVGYGVSSSVNLFETPPLIEKEDATAEEVEAIASYRTAIEALTTIAVEIDEQSAEVSSADAVLKAIVDDMSGDGKIDGVGGADAAAIDAAAIATLKQNPTDLVIPGTKSSARPDGIKVSEVSAKILAQETRETLGLTEDDVGELQEAAETINPDIASGDADPDRDGDGVTNNQDVFPDDSNEYADFDGDGIGDQADTDDDGDGVADADDAFPLDENESLDSDGDGIGNVADTDDDGDGIADADDALPLDKNESVDTDGDGTGNVADTDDDNDGVDDADDAFPLDATEQFDTDGDGIGNVADTDDDGDGVADLDDVFPLDKNESLDTDGDLIGNAADNDDDGDGIDDVDDAFPLDATEQLDTDGDGIGNNTDTDDDNDGIPDGEDSSPLEPDTTPGTLTWGEGTWGNGKWQ